MRASQETMHIKWTTEGAVKRLLNVHKMNSSAGVFRDAAAALEVEGYDCNLIEADFFANQSGTASNARL